VGDDEDQARIRALEAEIERLQTRLEDATTAVAETDARGDRRRDRFEAELERRDRLMEHAEGRIRRRDAAIAAAQGELARPLVRPAVRLDRLLRRIARRLRGKPAPVTADPPTPAAAREAGATDSWRQSVERRIASAAPRVMLVGPDEGSTQPRAALVAAGWQVVASEADGTTAADAIPDVVVATSPEVPFDSLPERSLRMAWVVDGAGWLSNPRFDDYDVVLTPDQATAATVARQSAHRPEVVDVDPGRFPSATRAAVRAWSERPTIAIHIPPADWEVAGRWGDTQFARGLQRGFAAIGWTATVHLASETDAPRAASADVAIHLQGVSTPPIRDGQPTALWIISHPDRVRAAQCQPYDLVFVASDPFAAELARRVAPPVRSLHQATDPDRFFPEAGGPAHDVLFVGNSRGVRRPVLDAVAASPFELAVYGSNWKPELLDPRHVRGTWIANADLHRYYSSASVVLSDHWPDMRDEGFIANRVYDALASGAFVISDRVAGIDRQFDGAVATYGTEDELQRVLAEAMADPAERRRRAQHGREIVLSRDTFERRARAIAEAFRAHGLLR
jgi:glycosyltransferase involved in cell wall biosynthesis